MQISTLSLTLLVALALLPVPAPAEPPAHAKAHGWRKKNDPNYVGYTGKKWEKDYGVVAGRCNTAAVGAVLGGVAGGAVGARAAERQDRPVAIIVGTAIGALIGHKIGQQLDDRDRGCMGHALELAEEKKTVAWTNKATGVTYHLTPTRGYTERGVSCREFTTRVTTSMKRDALKGTACRQGNGDWEFRT
jgi:surface antigen